MDTKDTKKVTNESKVKESKVKESKVKESKAKKPRCFHCKKKLKMTELNFICKCKHTFCHLHLNPHSHKCSFDYLKERQEQIQKDNPKMCQQCIEVK